MVDKPLIQYAVEEAYEAGIRDMVFVTGRSKRAIEDHFDTSYELENELENAGKQAMLDLVRSVSPADMNCLFVRQPAPWVWAMPCCVPNPGRQRTLCRDSGRRPDDR